MVPKAASDEQLRQEIEVTIKNNKVILFMKGSLADPQCSFSARAAQMINDSGVIFATVDVLSDPRIRQQLASLSHWPTIPQLFVDGELIGGADIIAQLNQSGSLRDVLDSKQAARQYPERIG